jgi:hypothetical protein
MDNTATASPRQPGLLYSHSYRKQCERSVSMSTGPCADQPHSESNTKHTIPSRPSSFPNESRRVRRSRPGPDPIPLCFALPSEWSSSRESAAATAPPRHATVERYWGGFGARAYCIQFNSINIQRAFDSTLIISSIDQPPPTPEEYQLGREPPQDVYSRRKQQ